MERKVIVMRGIPCSGKTTWADAWVSEDPDNRGKITNTSLEFQRFVDEANGVGGPAELLVSTALYYCMGRGIDICVDADGPHFNGFDDAYVETVRASVAAHNEEDPETTYSVEFHDCFTPLKECLFRDSLREAPLGAKAIKKAYRKYRHKMICIEIEKMMASAVRPAAGLPSCMIADMDATLCFNVTCRPFFGEGVAPLMASDIPNAPVVKLVRNYLKCASPEDRVYIITGREDVGGVREATEEYVRKHVTDDPRCVVLMRPAGDHSPGDESKRRIYEGFVKGRYNVDFVVDDSQKVVDMYRSIGLTVLQPNAGNF